MWDTSEAIKSLTKAKITLMSLVSAHLSGKTGPSVDNSCINGPFVLTKAVIVRIPRGPWPQRLTLKLVFCVPGSVQTRGPELTEGSGQGQDLHEPAAAKRQQLRRAGGPVLGRRRGRAGARDHCVPGLRWGCETCMLNARMSKKQREMYINDQMKG